jgi:TonB family protein
MTVTSVRKDPIHAQAGFLFMREPFTVLAAMTFTLIGGIVRADPVRVTPQRSASNTIVSGPVRNEPRLLVFETSERFACAGGEVTPLVPPDFTPTPTTVMLPGEGANTSPETTYNPLPIAEPVSDYTFSVSEDGRVLDLIADKTPPQTVIQQPVISDTEVQPALASLRFPPGNTMSGCRARVAGKVLPVDVAGRALLLKAYTLNTSASMSNLLFRAALPPKSDCYSGEPLRSRVRYYAATDEIEEKPGERAWSAVQFDVAPDGSTRKVQVAASSGSAELDRRATQALRRSSFAPQAKRGCMFRYWDQPGITVSPPEPPVTPARGCPVQPKLRFAIQGVFPAQFSRRRIEGYALVQFDVAPWGQLGQVKVLKAEPAQAFSGNARFIVQTAHAPSGQAATGCTQVVRFRMAPAAEAAGAAP